jgi:hypothetical protein
MQNKQTKKFCTLQNSQLMHKEKASQINQDKPSRTNKIFLPQSQSFQQKQISYPSFLTLRQPAKELQLCVALSDRLDSSQAIGEQLYARARFIVNLKCVIVFFLSLQTTSENVWLLCLDM